MDPHLNIFQAYHGGNTNSPDHINRLEDNLTRAFLITLRYLPNNELIEFLKNLGFKNVPKKLKFDLQNLSDKQALKRIQKSKQKFVLLISRDKVEPSQLKIAKSDTVQNTRPDGWIYGDLKTSSWGILIESKVGENKQSAQQIYRHITDKERSGFGILDHELSWVLAYSSLKTKGKEL